MQIYNQTRCVTQFTQGMDVAGREYLSLVIKGTLDFPEEPGGQPTISPTAEPLVMADEYWGEPGFSAVKWETDFAFRKHRCDVILNGCAHAPGGTPATRVRVGIRVGQWSKTLDVVGDRAWRYAGPSIFPSDPLPFTRIPITYARAWGGIDRLDPKTDPAPAYMANPVGTGWADATHGDRVGGLPLPNLQAVGEEITSPHGAHTPVSLGPISRAHPRRLPFGGTYDDHWTKNVFPFLPEDFDERYYQSAPQDQWIDFPRPGTEVTLVNLTQRGRESFRLPNTDLPVTLFRGGEIALERKVPPDTLLFDTEARKLSLVWRVEAPIRRTILDYEEAWVGPPTRAMLKARAEGRTYIRAEGGILPEDAE